MNDGMTHNPPQSFSNTSSMALLDDNNNNNEDTSDTSSLFTTGSASGSVTTNSTANNESEIITDSDTSSLESGVFVIIDKKACNTGLLSKRTNNNGNDSCTLNLNRPKRARTILNYSEIQTPYPKRCSSRKKALSTNSIQKEIDGDVTGCNTDDKKGVEDPPGDSIYEVESVLDYTVDDKAEYYLVKWKGWSESENTWEPAVNLEGCGSLIKKFHRLNPYLRTYRNKYLDDYDDSTLSGKLDGFLRRNARIITKLIQDLSGDVKSMKSKKIRSCINEIVRTMKNEDDEYQYNVRMPEGMKKLTMSKRKFQRFLELKAIVKQKLEDWQVEINKVSSDPAPIVVINDVDLEYAPESFKYINDYEAGEGICIPDDPLVGCECEDCYENRSNCCGYQSGSLFAYTKYKKLKVPAGSPIYECNKRCGCGPECLNRVVQHGRKMKLAIFRTSNLCGWGVKTLEAIPKGAFVMEYVGEVVTEQEAERRGHKYDEEGRTYLFDLDYDDGDCPFTVDAAYQGNVSHFMNHSCDPNLAVYGVWINSLDPRLPRLAFFSLRDIRRGEELSFDYMMSANGNSTSEGGGNNLAMSPKLSKVTCKTDSTTTETKRILCKCGSSSCRKYLF